MVGHRLKERLTDCLDDEVVALLQRDFRKAQDELNEFRVTLRIGVGEERYDRVSEDDVRAGRLAAAPLCAKPLPRDAKLWNCLDETRDQLVVV